MKAGLTVVFGFNIEYGRVLHTVNNRKIVEYVPTRYIMCFNIKNAFYILSPSDITTTTFML